METDLPFELRERISSGTFGTVHRGCLYFDGSYVAVKIINKDGYNRWRSRANSSANVLDEVTMLQTIQTPEVVRYISHFDRQSKLYVLTEFLEGATLFDSLDASGHFSTCRVYEIFRQILSGLCRVHSLGILHRDINPNNIMLCRSSVGHVAKLIDFGLACVVHHSCSTFVGTCDFIAPEIYDVNYGASCRYDQSVDIWSTGATMYAALCAASPPSIVDYPREDDYLREMFDCDSYSEDVHLQETTIAFLSSLLAFEPTQRPVAAECVARLCLL